MLCNKTRIGIEGQMGQYQYQYLKVADGQYQYQYQYLENPDFNTNTNTNTAPKVNTSIPIPGIAGVCKKRLLKYAPNRSLEGTSHSRNM